MMLIPELADREAFRPYGDVIIPNRNEPKEIIADAFERCEPGLKYTLSVNSLPPHEGGVITVCKMERHPHSSQIFIPLTPGNYLCVVGLGSKVDELDLASVAAFLVPRSRGIIYHPGTWHFAFTALGGHGDVAVIIGKTGQETDTEYIDLSASINVDISDYRGNTR